MINPPVSDLLKVVDNRYRLVSVTAKRARQIIDHQDLLVEDGNSDKPLTTAIDEVNQGLVTYEEVSDSIK